MVVDLSCRNWFEKLQAGKPPLPDGLPLDVAEANAAINVFEKLRLPDVPGQPLLRDVAGQWARDFVGVIFGLVEMNDARTVVVNRKVRKFFQLVPKKNSKTTNGAAIMMTALLRNRRPNAEFLLVGPTQATAELAYDQAAGMVMADPWLKKRFHTRDHQKTIEDRKLGAKLKIKSFDNKVMTGVKPVAVLVDELHELGKIPYAQKVMAQIEGGIIANPEGFIVIITTQSDAPPAGVFETELKHARAVRDGEYEGGETLAMLYEFPLKLQADEAKPWEDPKLWPLVLPNLNRSVTIDRLLPLFRENKEKGIEAFSIWASQHLNVEIGIAINGTSWRGADFWLSSTDKSLTLDSLIERCEVCCVGIDGGGLDDLFGFGVIGREKETKRWLWWSKAWAHREVLERRKDISEQLQSFDDVTICDDATQDIREAADLIERLWIEGILPETAGVGLDPFAIAALIDELMSRGIPEEMLVSIRQGTALSPATWGMERKLKDGTLVHADQPLMKWCVSNAKVEVRGGAILITKQTAGRAKIDPLVAGFNAGMLMSRNPEAQGISVYESRGILEIEVDYL
ncbi:terminase large subunit [Neorhizobium galegae]|uniref:terminase large subunit n=1 Tax=Neorhizobium galegae TaxID=399 RepID=UPI001F42C818|nr:terminase large subunit [Neorhizobium galegae]UIK04896.1 terminase large subunit [Neorhizobium galegae]